MIEVPESTQPPMVIHTPNRDFACGQHVIPHGRDVLYVGAADRFTTAPATAPTAGEHLSLVHGLLHQFRVDLRTATVKGLRWGNRPASADGAPLIGIDARLSIAVTMRKGPRRDRLVHRME